ncbi:MAG: YIP1 family protein [Promethearchaeota archaeon]
MSNNSPKGSPKFCGNCGQKLLGGATFCAYCGTPVPTVDPTGVVSSKPPSSYPSIVRDRGTPSYPDSYRPERITAEHPSPFFQHFQGVLISPQQEMARIVKRPNLGQPFLVVLIAGIISGIALFVLSSKSTIEFTQAFYDSLGFSGMDISMEEVVEVMTIFTAFFAPLGFIISWLIGSVILWILLSIISSQVPSHERNFKTIATIIGWSFLPRIFSELIRLILFSLFTEPTTYVVNDIFDLSSMSTPLGITGDILFFIEMGILIWGVVLIYFAAKSLDPEGSHAVIIGIIYAVVMFFLG